MVGLMSWEASMGAEQGWRKGPWTPEEDRLLFDYVTLHGEGRWSSVARGAGLNRSGKSCRLRWVNYLRPGLKKGQITPQEEGIIIELHALWGNKWSTIARYLPGRTDNEIKNYWRTHFKKKERTGRKGSQRRKSQTTKPTKHTQPRSSKPKLQHQESPKPTQTSEISNILPIEIPVTNTERMNQQQIDSKEELIFMYPNSTMEEEQNNLIIPTTAWMDAICHDQDGPLWNGLWNFGDQTPADNSLVDQMQPQDYQYCSKLALSAQQNQTNNNVYSNLNGNSVHYGFSWGGEANNLYNIEGCIF